MSYEEPSVTFGCRSQQKLIKMKTVNEDDGNTYTVYCCKFDASLPRLNPPPKILAYECEYGENGKLVSYTGIKPGDDLVCAQTHELVTVSTTDIVKKTPVTLSCCQQRKEVKPSAVKAAGAECFYLRDGTLKINYMDYCEDGAICRTQHTMKKLYKSGYDRCCCQEDKSLPFVNTGIKVKPLDCAWNDDGVLRRWSIIKYGHDLACNPGFKIHKSQLFENGADVRMACCIKDDPTTTTKAPVTTTTTPKPGKNDPPPPAIVGTQCIYNKDRSLKSTFMEPCTTNYVCRSQHAKIEMSVPNAQKNLVKRCCCDFRKELSANSTNEPTIIAPKCIYDHEGYVSLWSTVESGSDLGCIISDNLMTYELGSELSNKMSCCVKKDIVLPPTTLRPPPVAVTTAMPTTSTVTTTKAPEKDGIPTDGKTDVPVTPTTPTTPATTKSTSPATTATPTPASSKPDQSSTAIPTPTTSTTPATPSPATPTKPVSPTPAPTPVPATPAPPFKGKRTAPPKTPQKRKPLPGECPDCLPSKSGPVDSLVMIIEHLKMEGPEIGRCPTKTHTMRKISPRPEYGFRRGRCCCESDLYPVSYRLN